MAAPGALPRSMDTHSGGGGDDERIVAAAAERNKGVITEALSGFLSGGAGGVFLEVASGTGQHTASLAVALPALTFQPTELDGEGPNLASIAAWTRALPNVLPPLQLDASTPDAWPFADASCRAVFVANMCHISPWEATQGLLKGAGRVLQLGGELFIYGPFSVDGAPTTESNAAFDASLRARNPAWGYRDVADVAAEAAAAGLALAERRSMPANNFLLAFTKAG